MISRIFFGLLAIGLGVLGLKYNYQIVSNSHRLEWFERNLGSGSTYLVYKIGSLILVIGGILYVTGFGPSVVNWLLSPLNQLFPQ